MISLNNNIIGKTCFPNNERILEELSDLQLNCRYNTDIISVEMRYSTDIDISTLILLKKYIDDNYPQNPTELIMKYIPYSRMDRKIPNYIFTLKYFCDIINDLNFDEVIVLDPHSNVSPALIKKCKEISIQPFIDKIIFNLEPDYIFFPDLGACKRYSEILKINIPYFYGNKKRNLQTGEIVEYVIESTDLNIENKNILIIDDLCAKGGTFYHASNALKEKGANKIYLYISHCENTIYKGKLFSSEDLIEKIFTTNSILDNWGHSKLVNIATMKYEVKIK